MAGPRERAAQGRSEVTVARSYRWPPLPPPPMSRPCTARRSIRLPCAYCVSVCLAVWFWLSTGGTGTALETRCSRDAHLYVRNDDCLDGDCGQWRQWSSLPTFHIFCPYLSQFMVGVIAHTHIVPTYCSGGPRFAHRVGHPQASTTCGRHPPVR